LYGSKVVILDSSLSKARDSFYSRPEYSLRVSTMDSLLQD